MRSRKGPGPRAAGYGRGGRRARGFTLPEVLVATALLGILLLSVLAPLTGLFGVTQRSVRQASALVLAHDAAEHLRGQWQDRVRYRRACVEGELRAGVAPPLAQGEDVRGQPLGAARPVNYRPDCAASSDLDDGTEPPPLRRVRLTASAPGGTAASLELELAAP